jgi:hypothetical protein
MKPDTVPFDYCGVVSSFCDPSIIRNIMNMDARSLVLLPVVAYSIDGSRSVQFQLSFSVLLKDLHWQTYTHTSSSSSSSSSQ